MTAVWLVALGVGAGALAAVLGVGGGIVFVPALVVVAGFSQQIAEGTSLAVIVVTAAVSTWGHQQHHRVVWPTALVIGAAGIVGALAGSTLALRLHADVLRRLFALLLALVAGRLLYGLRGARTGDHA